MNPQEIRTKAERGEALSSDEIEFVRDIFHRTMQSMKKGDPVQYLEFLETYEKFLLAFKKIRDEQTG